jgi:formate C-acetyltransferase
MGLKPAAGKRQLMCATLSIKIITPYEGEAFFLCGPTERTQTLWQKILELLKEEGEKGVLDVSAEVGSSITVHPPGYIDKENERIVGLQTDAPLKAGQKTSPPWRMDLFVFEALIA